MYCPKCRAEFREGFKECSACGVPLVKKRPPEPHAEYVDWKVVFVAPDENVLMVAQSRLESEGIQCFRNNEYSQDLIGLGRISGFNILTGPLELLVLPKDFKRAEKILSAGADPDRTR